MIIVFDNETTGLTLHRDAALEKQPKIIEFGAAILDRKGEIVEKVNFLINPGEPLTEEIIRITGITDADLVDAPTFPEVADQINQLFSKSSCAIAHNLPFDKMLLHLELTRMICTAYGEPQLTPELAQTLHETFHWPRLELCTVSLYKEEYGYNPKMSQLYEDKLGKKLDQTHRAIEDVEALVEIIQAERLWELVA